MKRVPGCTGEREWGDRERERGWKELRVPFVFVSLSNALQSHLLSRSLCMTFIMQLCSRRTCVLKPN